MFGDYNTVNMYGNATIKTHDGQWYCTWNNYGPLSIAVENKLEFKTAFNNFNNAAVNVTAGLVTITGNIHSGKILGIV